MQKETASEVMAMLLLLLAFSERLVIGHSFTIENQIKPDFQISIACKSDADCRKEIKENAAHTATCIGNECKCGERNETCRQSEIVNVNRMVVTSQLGESCRDDTDCFPANSICEEDDYGDSMCVCKSGFFASLHLNRCLRILETFVGPNSTCDDDIQCNYLIPWSKCIQRKCSCRKGYHYVNGGCWPMSNLGQYCISTNQCVHIAKAECIDSKCTCIENFTSNANHTRCLQIATTVGTRCLEHDQCKKRLGGGGECDHHFCRCRINDYFFNLTQNRCQSNYRVNEECQADYDCYEFYEQHVVDGTSLSGKVFCDSSIARCRCRDSYQLLPDEICISKADLSILGVDFHPSNNNDRMVNYRNSDNRNRNEDGVRSVTRTGINGCIGMSTVSVFMRSIAPVIIYSILGFF